MDCRFLVLACLCFGSLGGAAHASDGTGYSGPEDAGLSIPVNTDHSVTLKDIVDAHNVCDLLMIQKLYQQLFKAEPTLDARFSTDPYPLDITVPKDMDFTVDPSTDRRAVLYSDKHEMGASIDYRNIYMTPVKEKNVTELVALHVKAVHDLPDLIMDFEIHGLPAFSYTAEITEGSYDEYGRLDRSRVILKDLTVSLPTSHGRDVKIYNRNSGGPTSMTVDTVAYANCLLAGIQ